MKNPVESWTHELKPNGLQGKSIRKYSYVVTLCEKDGHNVQAVRIEFYLNKIDVHKAVEKQYPDWNIKTINRLYDEDFD